MKRAICAALFLLLLNSCARASGGKLVLPSALTAIEAQAFYGDSSVETVVLPDGLESIGSLAFAYSGVKSINLPDTIVFIANNAFMGCTLEQVDAKGEYALNWCREHGIGTAAPSDPDEGEPFRP